VRTFFYYHAIIGGALEAVILRRAEELFTLSIAEAVVAPCSAAGPLGDGGWGASAGGFASRVLPKKGHFIAISATVELTPVAPT